MYLLLSLFIIIIFTIILFFNDIIIIYLTSFKTVNTIRTFLFNYKNQHFFRLQSTKKPKRSKFFNIQAYVLYTQKG